MDIPADAPIVGKDESDLLRVLREYHRTRDLTLRDKLVCENLNLVYSVSRRYSGMGESIDDLIQEGAIGLLNAVDDFDFERGVKFNTYASHLISGQIQHYLRDRGRLIRQPAWVQELTSRVSKATEELAQELGHEPQPEEIADHLQLNTNSIKTVQAARELSYIVSLTMPTDNGESEMNLADGDKLLVEKLTMMQLPLEDRIVMEDALSTLKELEQKVVHLYFYGGLNQTEVARTLSISNNYSSYLLRRSINKLKAALDEKHGLVNKTVETESVPIPAESLPHYDDLMGVYTSAYLHSRVKEEIARSQRCPTKFTLMLAQARGLTKSIDEQIPILQAIGAMMKTSTRYVDLTAYLGNGCFALLLPHTGQEARVLGERLVNKMIRRDGMNNVTSSVVLNIGFTVYPNDGADTTTLFAHAEKALKSAVRNGNNTLSGYDR